MDLKFLHTEQSEALTRHACKRLAFTTERFGHQIADTVVRFSDTNGPRGGADKQCRIAVELRSSGWVHAAAVSTDFASALDAASRTLQLRVADALKRKRDVKRRKRRDELP